MVRAGSKCFSVFTAIVGLVGCSVAATAGGSEKAFADPDSKAWVAFSGYDSVKDATYAYQGVVLALNRDIGKDGFVLRAYGSHTDYEYLSGVTKIDGDAWQGDIMVGYKLARDRWWAAAYIGAEYQKHDLTPDDLTNVVRGSKTGLKVAADFATLRDASPLYISLSGNYSTAFDSYWARARVGANVQRFTFGPELIALGNEGFDAKRVGGFVTFDLPLSRSNTLEVTLSAGRQTVDNGSVGSSGGEGTYFGISLSTVF